MKKEIEIRISEKDLKFILEDEFDQIMNLAKYNSFCLNCFGRNEVKMIEYTILLNDLNDVVFEGKCQSCNGKIARYIEIGEQAKFRMRTEMIKESKVNEN